jgi:hypothetical protein
MKLEVAIPDYSRDAGLHIDWEPDHRISLTIQGAEVTLRANRAGMESLARLLLALSQPELPLPYHVHLDEWNSLESGSAQLILEVDDAGGIDNG